MKYMKFEYNTLYNSAIYVSLSTLMSFCSSPRQHTPVVQLLCVTSFCHEFCDISKYALSMSQKNEVVKIYL